MIMADFDFQKQSNLANLAFPVAKHAEPVAASIETVIARISLARISFPRFLLGAQTPNRVLRIGWTANVAC